MYYIYLIKSDQNGKCYIGYTANLKQRIQDHNSKKSIATKAGVPWKLIYYEAYSIKKYALIREKKLKQYGKGLAMLKKRIGIM